MKIDARTWTSALAGDLESWNDLTPPWEIHNFSTGGYSFDPIDFGIIEAEGFAEENKNEHQFIDIEFGFDENQEEVLYVSSKNKGLVKGGSEIWRYDTFGWNEITQEINYPRSTHFTIFINSDSWTNHNNGIWNFNGTSVTCSPGINDEQFLGRSKLSGQYFIGNSVPKIRIKSSVPEGANLFLRAYPDKNNLTEYWYIPLSKEFNNWVEEDEFTSTSSLNDEIIRYFAGYSPNRLEIVVKTNEDYDGTTPIEIEEFEIYYDEHQIILCDVPDNTSVYATGIPITRKVPRVYKSEDQGLTFNYFYGVEDPQGSDYTVWDYGDENKFQFEVSNSNIDEFYIGGVELMKVHYDQVSDTYLEFDATLGGSELHDDIRYLNIPAIDNATGNHMIHVGCDGGNAFSFDGGSSWVNKNGEYFPTLQTYGLSISDQDPNRYLCGAMDNQTWLKVRDEWSLFGGSDGADCEFDPENPNIFYYNDWGPVNKVEIDEFGNEISDNYLFGVGRFLKAPLVAKYGNIYAGGNSLYKDDGSGQTVLNELSNPTIAIKGEVSAIAISDQDQNKIYFADNGLFYNDPIEGGLFKTEDEGLNWIEISGDQNVYRWHPSTDLELDPENDNELLISFGSVSGTVSEKVMKISIDNNTPTYTDWSEGLTLLPINSIEIDKNSRIVYCCDDIGVYYRHIDDPVGGVGWQCFSNGLPPAIVSDIDINNCSQELVCSTYGRGLWKAPLISGEDEIINVNSVFAHEVFYNNLRITNGAEVTITGDVSMAAGKHIYIEKGCRLTIDGGTISNECGRLWDGIYVEGDVTTSQDNFADKGYLKIINEGTIQNALVGVRNFGLKANGDTEWNSTGGIIYCEDANFTNNWKSVEFLSYQNFNVHSQTQEQIPKVDRSNFKRCTFEINAELPQKEFHDAHVSMYKVDGIGYSGCTFANYRSDQDAEGFDRGEGIRSINATYYVTADCPVTNPSCDESNLIRGIFHNLKNGINAQNFDDFYTLEVNRSDFFQNHRSIILSSVNNATITQNTFSQHNEPGFEITNPLLDNSVAMLIQGSTGYEIEDNLVDATASPGYLTAGLIIQGSGPDVNEVYRNLYSNLYVGTLVQGQNRNTTDNTGLEVLCNWNSGNDFDIALEKLNTQDGSHALEQGNAGFNETDPAGNIFSSINCSVENSLYSNPSSALYIYNHHTNSQLTPQLGCYTLTNVIPNEITGNPSNSYDSSCPTRLSREEDREDALARAMQARAAADSLVTMYFQIADDGNTQSIVNYVTSAASSFDKRGLLLTHSPNLSDSSLASAINAIPALNTWHLTEVMIENSPLSLDIHTAYMAMSSVPQFFKDLVENYQSGVSTLGSISQDIRENESGEWKNSRDFIRTILLRDTSEFRSYDILDLVNNLNENRAIRTSIANYISLGNYTEARARLAEYNFSANDAFPLIQEIVLDIYELNMAPDINDYTTLENIAYSNQLGKYKARSLLSFLRQDDFPEEISWPSYQYNSLSDKNEESLTDESLYIYPNPAKDLLQIAFLYGNEINDVEIFIHDLQGKLLYSKRMEHFGLDNIDVSDFANGNYILSLWSNNIKLDAKNFVVENE